MMMASRRGQRLSEGRSPGDRQCPFLQLECPLIARQYDVRGFVPQGSHPPVAAFGDVAGVIDLAGLIAARHYPDKLPDREIV